MIPINKIEVGNMFQDKWPRELVYIVEDVDKNEKMVLIKGFSLTTNYQSKSFWTKNTNSIFNESNRI